MFDAYIDIETTGLSWLDSEITVVGIYLANSKGNRLEQLVGGDISQNNLQQAVKGVSNIYTYNGSRFDLPFIRESLGVDLETMASHHDLMYDCWRCNLRGGFKAVEQQLGISRQLKGISGLDAIFLWQRYRDHGDQEALSTLLKYNEEDVTNLKVLKEKLVNVGRLAGA